ncbi:hypothetical protein [Microbacterium sp. NPDC090003]|uniref:hypothetical protein n=1 Tax=Microbacterium sp. NPDC090003 TaxID=3364203 RepID=UPI00381A9B17
MDIGRGVIIGAVLIVGAGLVGCTAGSSDAETPRPSATTTSTPSPTPTEDASSDEAQLPIPVDEIRAWADTAVPPSENVSGAGSFSGWLSQHTSPNHLTNFTSLEAGTFQGQIACRGAGTLTLSAGELDAEAASDPVPCTNGTIAFEVTTTQTGMSIRLELEGAPTLYAVSLQRIA